MAMDSKQNVLKDAGTEEIMSLNPSWVETVFTPIFLGLCKHYKGQWFNIPMGSSKLKSNNKLIRVEI